MNIQQYRSDVYCNKRQRTLTSSEWSSYQDFCYGTYCKSADLILLDGPFKSLDPHYSVQWKETLFSWYCIVSWLYFCYIFYFTFKQNKFTKHSYKSFHLVCKLISHQCKSKALTCSSGKTLARRALQIFLENNINVFFTQSSKIMHCSCNSDYPLRSIINSIIH